MTFIAMAYIVIYSYGLDSYGLYNGPYGHCLLTPNSAPIVRSTRTPAGYASLSCTRMPMHMSIHMSIHMSKHMSKRMSKHMSKHMFKHTCGVRALKCLYEGSYIHANVYLLRSTYMSMHTSIHMSTHMSVDMPAHMGTRAWAPPVYHIIRCMYCSLSCGRPYDQPSPSTRHLGRPIYASRRLGYMITCPVLSCLRPSIKLWSIQVWPNIVTT